jgi:hypothetical protein
MVPITVTRLFYGKFCFNTIHNTKISDVIVWRMEEWFFDTIPTFELKVAILHDTWLIPSTMTVAEICTYQGVHRYYCQIQLL